MAKYPFLQESKEHVSRLDIGLEELAEVEGIVDRAKERIIASFELVSHFSQKPSKDPEVEVASFPVSVMLVIGVEDNALTERFALHEARTIYEHLRNEKNETVLGVAKHFDWRIRETKESLHPFAMRYTDYLRNATRGRLVHDPEWKIVNKQLHRGEVLVSKREVCRLLQEEVKKYVEGLAGKKISTVPQNIQEVIDEIKPEFEKIKPHLEEFDKVVKAEESEYPPCIRIFLDRAVEGQHLSHTERFTLVTYLLHQGVSIDGIINMFANVVDFKENKTRYQVEHLAGQRGSQTTYRPYNCSTLKTHGVCPDPDDPICHTIQNPLTYHLRKKPAEEKA